MKVKKVKFTLEEAMKTQRGIEVQLYSFFNLGCRCGGGVTTHGRDTVSIVQEAGWDPGHIWTAAENYALSGIRFPDRPARSLHDPYNQSNLYGLP